MHIDASASANLSHSAQDGMDLCNDIKLGNPAATTQHMLTPPFQFAGVQQIGTLNREEIRDKKVLVYGAGDVWYKFILAPLLHLGVKPENITIIEKERPKKTDLDWQYKDINFVTCDEVAANPQFFDQKKFGFAIVATPPSAHEKCAKEAIEHGLPVLIEKPLFASTREYDSFEKFCEEKGGHVVAIDWQRALSTLLYSALGQDVPFEDGIAYTHRDEFQALRHDKIKHISARFVEGRGNALADIAHRKHLVNASLQEGGWASAGMLADMGIHPINALTGAGFRLDRITDAFFGGTSDEKGDRPVVARTRTGGNSPEMYARVHAEMSRDGQNNIPVEIECGKGSAPNVNDGRTIVEFKSGKKLVHEFGHRVNKLTLYDANDQVLATAKDRGEPYARMFLEASVLFDRWAESAKGKARIAYGAESREAIRVVEESHRHACDNPSPADRKERQLALNEMGELKDHGQKAAGFETVTIGAGQYKTVSSDEVIKGSCQRHATSEGAIFDKNSGCFFYVDIEHGLLVSYNPANAERHTWKMTDGTLDTDGRPKQMLSVAAVNHDGSVLVMLSEGGQNAGLNYFNPNTHEFTHIGKVPELEKMHLHNRPNDATTIQVDGKNCLLFGTMSKHWDKHFDTNSEYQRTGAYYLLDPQTLESHKLQFEEGKCPSPLITNGLADGGDAGNGKRYLFWAETVEDPDKGGAQLNVYRGVLDPKSYSVSNIEIFKNHQELGGMMNGVETFGRPDGACMAKYNEREVYGISMLDLGQIRFYYSDPKDPEYKSEALRIQLPPGLTRNTRFALGTDKGGQPIALVTSQDAGHFSRRWNVDGDSKARDGINGEVITFALPKGLTAHEQAIAPVDYPAMEQAKQLADKPPEVVDLGPARANKLAIYERGIAT